MNERVIGLLTAISEMAQFPKNCTNTDSKRSWDKWTQCWFLSRYRSLHSKQISFFTKHSQSISAIYSCIELHLVGWHSDETSHQRGKSGVGFPGAYSCNVSNTSRTNIHTLFYYLDEPDCWKHVTSETATRIEPKTSAALPSLRWHSVTNGSVTGRSIGYSVANGPLPLRGFFGAVLLRPGPAQRGDRGA